MVGGSEDDGLRFVVVDPILDPALPHCRWFTAVVAIITGAAGSLLVLLQEGSYQLVLLLLITFLCDVALGELEVKLGNLLHHILGELHTVGGHWTENYLSTFSRGEQNKYDFVQIMTKYKYLYVEIRA